MLPSDIPQLQSYIMQLEQKGLVTRTFRRLDPERQMAVINAILDEAAERGPADTNIKQVARRAGVAVGSLYQYFTGRDKMLDFAVDLCVRYIKDAFQQYGPYLAALPLRQGLSEYLAGGIEWSQSQDGFLQLFARAAYQGNPALNERLVRPIADTLRGMIGSMLEQAALRGEIRAEVDLDTTTRLVHALMIVVGDSQLLPYLNTYFQVTDPLTSPGQLLEALLDFILKGIGRESK
jgi:AcrR family transcriptional regulator